MGNELQEKRRRGTEIAFSAQKSSQDLWRFIKFCGPEKQHAENTEPFPDTEKKKIRLQLHGVKIRSYLWRVAVSETPPRFFCVSRKKCVRC